MTKRSVLMGLLLVGVVVGFGGYGLVSRLPLLGGIGFLSAVALLVVFAVGGPDRSWRQADDLHRADQHEEHRMSDGPAPPFQS
jgi:hypothetical protein